MSVGRRKKERRGMKNGEEKRKENERKSEGK